MNETNATRQGLLLILGALACLAVKALLGFAFLTDGGVMNQAISLLRMLAQYAGYGLFLAGATFAIKQANGTSRFMLFGAVAFIGLGLAMSLFGLLLGRVSGLLGGNAIDSPVTWYLNHSFHIQTGLQLIAFAFYYYFLLSLDYTEDQFRQGMIGWVAPGRGFAFGMLFAIFGVLQIGLAAIATSGLWLGDVMLAFSAALLAMATFNNLPPHIAYVPPTPYAAVLDQNKPAEPM